MRCRELRQSIVSAVFSMKQNNVLLYCTVSCLAKYFIVPKYLCGQCPYFDYGQYSHTDYVTKSSGYSAHNLRTLTWHMQCPQNWQVNVRTLTHWHNDFTPATVYMHNHCTLHHACPQLICTLRNVKHAVQHNDFTPAIYAQSLHIAPCMSTADMHIVQCETRCPALTYSLINV